MNKEEIMSVAQLLSNLKDNSRQLESAIKAKDMERVMLIKREMLKINDEVLKAL